MVLHAMPVVRDRDHPRLFERANRRQLLPAMFLVMAPATNTFTFPSVPRARRISATVPALSIAGDVLGMQTTEAKPPRAAAAVPWRWFLWPTCPGSRK